ncbi:hypothetical protein SAMN05421544_11147 [Riemerella columbipharyngis]|uniref:Uncharacterized protein n=1 Tax=Riemerella columbipharyngis TaxID=1071918 RepID=A0A1G7DKR7_9FLAO|nr:hypothetical protein SAMN05421544_11147 [Riemerella columbipharyngis]
MDKPYNYGSCVTKQKKQAKTSQGWQESDKNIDRP